ncbi:cytochrome c [Roseibacterium sp. SDUM158016]|jgi:cytochrome c556|uniref:c-type cytochrome n=1 Tax=Roseicyclus sediminis TaxID=2980997 RepID=UPI0021D3E0E1|nr:cytochrome c [Roseibacterium sp. SDUM158016]MCU4651858.1 cytochrome c [Roseibacterium sp. SDUM158016]
MTIRKTAFGLAALAALATSAPSAFAQDLPAPVQARQGQMDAMALNIGVLAGMARGNTEYDAEAAQAAANNLVALSQIDQRFSWPEGTDNFSLDGSRALPAIWENMAGFTEDYVAFGAAATGLAAVAGDGLEAVQAALGPLGGTCGACHDDFRQSQ